MRRTIVIIGLLAAGLVPVGCRTVHTRIICPNKLSMTACWEWGILMLYAEQGEYRLMKGTKFIGTISRKKGINIVPFLEPFDDAPPGVKIENVILHAVGPYDLIVNVTRIDNGVKPAYVLKISDSHGSATAGMEEAQISTGNY